MGRHGANLDKAFAVADKAGSKLTQQIFDAHKGDAEITFKSARLYIPVSRGFPRPNARAVAARRTAAGPGGSAAHFPRHLSTRTATEASSDSQLRIGSGGSNRAHRNRADRIGRIGSGASEREHRSGLLGSGGSERADRSERIGSNASERVVGIGRIGAGGSELADLGASGRSRADRMGWIGSEWIRESG